MTKEDLKKAMKAPIIWGLAHGILFGLGWCSFLLNFIIAEYNDPVTGELVLLHQYELLADICEIIFSLSLISGLVLVIANIIDAIRSTIKGGKLALYLITIPVAIVTAILLGAVGSAAISIIIP